MDKKRFNSLLKRINTDKLAYNEIYADFFPAVVFSLTRFFRNRAFAEDIAQDFFFKKICRITVPDNIEFPLAWMIHSCKNLAYNTLKREENLLPYNDHILSAGAIELQKSQLDYELLSYRNQALTDEEFFAVLSEANVSADILKAFRDLGRETAEIFVLLYFEKYSQKEIAKLLNMNFGTLRSKISRGSKLLKYFLRICNIILHFCGLYR